MTHPGPKPVDPAWAMCAHEERERFVRAFVAVRYLLGARDEELGAELPQGSRPRLIRQLQQGSQQLRGRALALALLEVARALERRRFA